MAETTKPPCKICNGSYEEHFDAEGKPRTKHAYTTDAGQLMTHAQQQQQQQKAVQGAMPQVIRLPGAQTNEAGAIGRLVEVLLDRQLISTQEALYVAGMGSKPDPPITRDVGKFKDPVIPGMESHPFYQSTPGAGY